jgi:hypothetical protein
LEHFNDEKKCATATCFLTEEQDYVRLLAAIQGWSKEDGRNGIRSSKLSNIAAFRRLGLSGQPATQVRTWKKPGLDRVAGKRISPTSAFTGRDLQSRQI